MRERATVDGRARDRDRGWITRRERDGREGTRGEDWTNVMAENVGMNRRVRARTCARRCAGKLNLPVVLVLGMYSYVYETTKTYAFHEGRAGGLAELVFALTAGLGMVMYACTVLRDPGRVPGDYVPKVEEGDALVEAKRKGGGFRFCQKCERHKPPRTHHCRVCKRCVLRMDHHCVWVNNCVGHYNYKSFFLFLFYATISLCQAAYHLGNFAASEIFNPRGSKFDDYKASSLVIGCLVVTCTLTIALAALFVWHVRLVVNNKTTIEHYEGVRSRYNNIPTVVEHPYSLGLLANLREILGRNVLFWFTPGCKISGDGTRYPNVLEMSRERWDRTVRTKERELTVL